MDLATFGADNGFVEAKLRGYRSSFLKDENYTHLKNVTSLEEMFQYLASETDYSDYIDISNISINSLKVSIKQKLSDEIDHIEVNCTQDLAKFIFFIRAGYMIDNVMNIMEGLKSGMQFPKLLASVDPLGYFPELKQTEIGASDIASLYEYVLIDSPVNDFFIRYLESFNTNRDLKNFNEVQSFFREEKPEKVRSMLKRIHLEMFYDYCLGLNDISQQNMCRLLEMEADFKTLQVIYNSFEDTKDERAILRSKLIPCLGRFYPLYYPLLKNVENLEQLKEVSKSINDYRIMMQEVQEPAQAIPGQTLEDMMYKEEVKIMSQVFDEQANLGVFYAYVKLKEQEIRNLIWYAEMVSRKIDKSSPNWKKIVVPFSSEL